MAKKQWKDLSKKEKKIFYIIAGIVLVIFFSVYRGEDEQTSQTSVEKENREHVDIKKNEKIVRSDMYGKDWPFTVSEGILRCEPGIVAISFEANGRKYGINGVGLSKYGEPTSILKDQKKGLYANLISDGLALCK